MYDKMMYDKIFSVTPAEKVEIKNFYEKSDEELSLMVKSLKKWIQTQPHLPQNQEDYFLDMMLKLNKFKEERTQKKIDMYYAMRNIVPEFYEYRSPVCNEMKNFMDTLMIVPLPQLTSALERVYLIKFLDTDPANFDLLQNARFLLAVFDIRLKYDDAIGERYVFDLSGLRLGHVLKVNPVVIKKIYTVIEKAYSDRIKGIHFLSMPIIGNALISLAKLILSEKLSNRVHSHKSLESLNEIIPGKLLPSDYNGSQESSDKLYETWRECFQNSADLVNKVGEMKSNEDLRVPTEENCSLFSGLWNIFKK